MLYVRLLGELQAEVDGRPSCRPRAAAPGACWPGSRCIPASTRAGAVAARFWPDVLDSSARASLRSAAWALRRALGSGEAARRRPRPDRPALRDGPRRLRRALRGGPARGRGRAAPRPAARRPRRGLGARGARRARGARSAPRSPASRRRRPPAEAVGYARRRLALDPLDEEAARDLMRRQAAAGDRAAALATLRPPRRPPAHDLRAGPVGRDPRACGHDPSRGRQRAT